MSKKPLLAGVIGDPIGHSRSPVLHGTWLRRYGIDGYYVPLHVIADDFPDALKQMPKMGFVGANVTIPHKEAALSLADGATDRARHIGAANTLFFTEDGLVCADNTDGYGFIENLKQNAPSWKATAGSALVLGAGGAARAVIAALLSEGVPEIILTNRTHARAEMLAADFGPRVRVEHWKDSGQFVAEARTIVNTSALGMTGKPPLGIDLSDLCAEHVVTDIVYTPLETDLLAAARRAGACAVDGLGMLLHQAAPGFEMWFGVKPEVDEALRKAVLG